MDNFISPEMVRDAAVRIRPLARRTPVMTSRSVDERSGLRAFLKCENFQRGGAFKIRGAANLVLSTPAPDLKRGVVAFSSGNHAQATAIAAKHVGAPATIVMPEDAPRSKMEPTRALGARIVTYNRFVDDREAIAARVLAETGGILVPPFDHPMIMAGQGTAGLELLEEAPDLDALVVCVGGGGLISGCATIAKSILPAIRIFGVEPELANDTYQSFVKGERVTIPPPDTIADGLRSPCPGKLTFPVIQRHVEQILLVTEDEIRATVRFLLERMKILVEPSGAVAAAAVLFGKLPAGIGKAGIIVSGGNVDLEFLKTC
ncbi:MAG TPA: threonine/serine dehydratase [Bryobacteraceae bacterium]|nr:threonine/serine dehydratase [Bryobacteraceae bacterium]